MVPHPKGDRRINDDIEGDSKHYEESNTYPANHGANEDGRSDGCKHSLEEEKG